nr:toll/interleukin-1 receptor domain-containing protein [Pelodictyon phaeoclathratiforme]
MKGCGLPDTFIEYAHSFTSKAIEFYSCFISHSTADKAFADRLYADLQAKGVRCWYAPHDMKGGKKIHVQIGEAIRQHEKLLLILSESSINSEWVKQEITKAKKREDREGKQVLFPISLIEFGKIQEWEFPDSKGRDLAEEIRLYYIPSFVGWEKDNEAYTREFGKLLNSFQAERDIEGKA